jgi:hypothetical protein
MRFLLCAPRFVPVARYRSRCSPPAAGIYPPGLAAIITVKWRTVETVLGTPTRARWLAAGKNALSSSGASLDRWPSCSSAATLPKRRAITPSDVHQRR